MGRQDPSSRARDFGLYILIGILVTLSVALFAIYKAKTGGSAELPLKWLGFIGMTGVVFGYGIRAHRRSWSEPRLWCALAFFAALHIALGSFLLWKSNTVPLVLFGVLAPSEFLLLEKYLSLFLD